MKAFPWHTRERLRRGIKIGFALGILFTCISLVGLTLWSACSTTAATKYAPIAASYKDQTPAATTQVKSQAADAAKIVESNIQAAGAGHDAKGFLDDALARFEEFWKSLPPAAARPAPIVAAENDVHQANDKVEVVTQTLTRQRGDADRLITSQQATIALLVQQADANRLLRDEAIEGAEKQRTMQASLTKYEEQDKDIFGRMRRAWRAFKWFCVIAIPLLIILGYLGVRYGANELTKPVATGIGAALGWIISGIRWGLYYLGTFICASIPFLGHWVDEHATNLKNLLARKPA